ncbi:MAG: helix-turn-helix domain-containing protein [Ilumatobacter sp.]|uniref:helix-turn-helix domain-containing protein n=1 Tax=Ilumatobacter sp. TaxID=1967498 RepID=UPI003C72FF1F
MNAPHPAPTADGDLADFFAEGTDGGGEPQAIGARIASARSAAGLSEMVLAERLGVTTETLAGWESGERPPRANHLTKLCGILGVAFSWLLVGSGGEPATRGDHMDQLRVDLTAARSLLDDVVNELTVIDQRLAQLDDD